MNGMNDLPLDRIVEILAAKGREGEYWDYKQEWHENMADLLKDIICFANTPHDANCYLLFGIDDDGHIVGMKKNRRKQADILEAMDNLWFIGDVRPEISVETVVVNEIEVDVLTVYDTQKTPIYLKRNYGEMLAGCIYMRNGDKNTPNRGMASIDDVEKLWKKRYHPCHNDRSLHHGTSPKLPGSGEAGNTARCQNHVLQPGEMQPDAFPVF